LQTAWQQQEFLLHFQPEVNVHTGQILGMEVLIRWQHPELGLIFPDQFFPLAEDATFFSSLQRWIFYQSCVQSQEWNRLGLPSGPMAVNISLNHLDPQALLHMIEALLKETGMDPKGLVIEIPQLNVLMIPEKVSRLVNEFVSLGVGCVLDNVSDTESLPRLIKNIPFQGLKLASSLLCDVPVSSEAVKKIQHCFFSARTAHLSIIAKGVESAAQVTFLREHGCHAVQGYLCSRPLPSDEMTALLSNWRPPVM